MGMNKSIVVRIAAADLETLKLQKAVLHIARPPVAGPGGSTLAWRSFGNLLANNTISWDEDYSLYAATSAKAAEGPDGAVVLWFGQHVEPGSVVNPSGHDAVVVDLSIVDSAVVTYGEGRWSEIESA